MEKEKLDVMSEDGKKKDTPKEEENKGQTDLEKRIAKLEAEIAEKDDHISNLNKESQERRLKLKQFEDDAEKAKQEEMEEVDRLKDELGKASATLTETQAELRKMQVLNAVGRETVINDEEVSYMLIDPEDFSLPDDKDIADIPAQLKALFKTKPHYFREAKPESKLTDDESPSDENNGGKKKMKKIELPRQRL